MTLPHIGAIAQREARAAQREGERGEKMKRRRIEHMGDHAIMVAMAKTEQLIVGLPIGGRESQSGERHCHFGARLPLLPPHAEVIFRQSGCCHIHEEPTLRRIVPISRIVGDACSGLDQRTESQAEGALSRPFIPHPPHSHSQIGIPFVAIARQPGEMSRIGPVVRHHRHAAAPPASVALRAVANGKSRPDIVLRTQISVEHMGAPNAEEPAVVNGSQRVGPLCRQRQSGK